MSLTPLRNVCIETRTLVCTRKWKMMNQCVHCSLLLPFPASRNFSHSKSPGDVHQTTTRWERKKLCFKFLIFHLILLVFPPLSIGRYILGLKRWIVESRRGIGRRRHAEASEQSRSAPADDTAAQGEPSDA